MMDFRQEGPKIAAVIRGKKSPATSMSYHEDGEHLFVTSEADCRLLMIDCNRGVSEKPAIKFEKDGVRIVQSTHHNQSLLYTGSGRERNQSSGEKHAINYHSIHDNKILRQFRGHSETINNISMCPVDDTFLTSSADRTVRLWDLRQAGSLALMEMPKGGNGMTIDPNGCPIAAFDSTGLVFGITAPMEAQAGHIIHLYDARNYGSGAFSEMKLESKILLNAIQTTFPSMQPMEASDLCGAQWKSMTFNKSGKQILITTDTGIVVMVDGYDSNKVTNIFLSKGVNGGPNGNQAAVACFSSDDQTVLVGNENGTISCYDSLDGSLLRTLEGHVGKISCVASNPKYAQIASACTNVALWLW
mmetsp:Transcript_17134/g.32419  ORF Transcript_17134/g.32419 Transcript_17134/m.32419 type:complete len:359 (-) Transcript_17134:57-1133(-)